MKPEWYDWAALFLVLSGMAVSIAATLVEPWFKAKNKKKT